jgi:hypothetical protein
MLLAGCANAPPRDRQSVMTTLYFGLTRPGGTVIADAEWQSFVEQEVVPRFPAGFTVLNGEGAWREQQQTIREPTRLIVVIRRGTAELDAAIDALRAAYCRRFNQESVMRVDQDVRRGAF